MTIKGICTERICMELTERGYAVPEECKLEEYIRNLDLRLRLLLDERFDVRGRVLASCDEIGKRKGMSPEEVDGLLDEACRMLSGTTV